MATTPQAQSWVGLELIGHRDEEIGKIDHLYVDCRTGELTFAAVKTGHFGTHSSLVPIGSARATLRQVAVPYSKEQVEAAPNVAADGALAESEEQQLYDHYDIASEQRDAARLRRF